MKLTGAEHLSADSFYSGRRIHYDEFARVAEDALALLAELFKCYEGTLWLARQGAVKDTLRCQAQTLREQYEALRQRYQDRRMKPESA